MKHPDLYQLADTIRVLSAEGVQKANSGHPGMPMGCADFAAVLWGKHLRHDPSNPKWLGRDRFVQSAGHGSMLTYSLLHLFGYGLPVEELARFRQWDSKTPGHPEVGHTAGVEITTGPLGTGVASAVGMAIASKQLAARTGATALDDQKIYALVGDGCMMEGVSSEAASLAGHLKLDNLVVFYDDNGITIEGSTQIAFTENVAARYRAYGWRVLNCNGNNIDQLDAALTLSKSSVGTPTLIVGKTQIGHKAPTKAGTHHTHGEPLGAAELAGLKAALGFPADQPFFVPADVRAACEARIAEMKSAAAAWNAKFEAWKKDNAAGATLFDQLTTKAVPANLLAELLKVVPAKDTATRQSSGDLMQKVAALVPALSGGSADLNGSTKTHLKDGGEFTADNRAGRNVHFGVREMAMGQIAIGMSLYGSDIPYTATFAVFSDFMKPCLRLAALQDQQVLFIYTHDSFFVGEDGPTHEPIEQLLMCRSIPNMTVLRPAESFEAAHCWAAMLANTKGPSCLFLTRQNLENIPEALRGNINVAKGAYVLSEDAGFEVIVIATGSEVMTAYRAVEALRKEGKKVRLVSMPSCELFLKQDAAYRESVLPAACRKRVTVEAGITLGWERFAGDQGLKIGLDRFGASAPANVLAEKFGLTSEAIAEKIRKYLA